MAVTRIRFAKRDATRFVEDTKTRVAAYFETTGKSQKADYTMVLKTIIILSVAIGSYLMIMSNRFTPWQMLGLAMVMGVAMAGIGFSIAHDALHGGYSSSPRINRMLGFTFDLSGANGYMWKITHNVIHHTYTNIHGIDEDLTVSPLLRLSPGADRKWFHRYQHLYGFAAYSMATINWIFVKDYQQFLKKDLGPYKDKKHPRSEWVNLIWTKLFCYLYMIILPLLILDIAWWQYVIGFVAMHLVAGTILGVIFQLAHVVEGTEYPVPDVQGNIDNQWVIHEMETTADFAHGNKVLSWYIGGLNYQIEHHLFPQVCSIHYPAIAKIIQEVAEETGVPYNNAPTLRAAIKSHYNMLKQLGVSDPVAQPHPLVAA
ncbi:MAG: fatty acid desaturase [Longimicrobiales bacterium]